METKWVLDLAGNPFIEMIKIPAGKFVMGSDKSSYNSEKPERVVEMSEYWIAKYPTTNRQFLHFIEETGYTNTDENFLQHWETSPDGSRRPPEELLDHPVVYVNWMDCLAFCKAYGLTLPSEAQWEKAARGEDERMYPWGNEEPDTNKPQCNFRNIFNGTTPVGTFDGSREIYNYVPIQKGTSPYGVEDMAGNVWEWCLDEWNAHWLENMGDNPIDPCNYKIANKRGLSLEQILNISSQLEGRREQLPFQDTECCGAVLGTSTIPPTSAPPIAATTSRRSGAATTALDVASKEAEEQNPFQREEYCGAVRGTTSLPPSSAPPIAATSTRRSGTSTSALDVASKEAEEQPPFQREEYCGAVRGTTIIPPTSAPPIASATTRRTGSTSTGCVVVSEEAEDQIPFSDTECCGAVRGTSSVPPSSAPPIASTTSRRSDTATTACVVASKEEQEEEKLPFSEHCMEDPGTSLDIGKSKTLSLSLETGKNHQQKEMMGLDSEVASEEEEGESPFQNTESCGAVHGTTTILPTSVPQIVATTTRHTNSTEIASESASEGEEVPQDPFHHTECHVEVNGSILMHHTPEESLGFPIPCRSGILMSASDASFEQKKEVEESPFQEKECYGEDRTTTIQTNLSSEYRIADKNTTMQQNNSQYQTSDSDAVPDNQNVISLMEDKKEQRPFQEKCCTEVHGLVSIPQTIPLLTAIASTSTEHSVQSDLDASSEQEAEEESPFQDIGEFAEVRGIITVNPTSAHLNHHATILQEETTSVASEHISKQQEVEEESPSQEKECCGEDRGTTTLISTSTQLIATPTTSWISTETTDSDAVSEEGEDETPFQETEHYVDVHIDALPLKKIPSSQHHDLIITQQENLISDSDAVSEQEGGEQFPFQQDCGAVLGTTSIPPSFVPPFVTTTTRRSGTSTSACVVASKEEQEGVEADPFQDAECCGAVRGTSTLPSTSTPPIATTSTSLSNTSSSVSVVVSKEEVEDQIPFQGNEEQEEARGIAPLQHSFEPVILSYLTSHIKKTGSDSDAASELTISLMEDKKEEFPFSNTEHCEEVHGISSKQSTSAPIIAVPTSIQAEIISSDSEVALEQEALKNIPFQEIKECEADHVTATSLPDTVSQLITIAANPTNTSVLDSEVALEREVLKNIPFQEIEEYEEDHVTAQCYGAVRCTSFITPAFAPPIATSTICHIDTTVTGSEVVLEQEAEEDVPFWQSSEGDNLIASIVDSIRTHQDLSVLMENGEQKAHLLDAAFDEVKKKYHPFPCEEVSSQELNSNQDSEQSDVRSKEAPEIRIPEDSEAVSKSLRIVENSLNATLKYRRILKGGCSISNMYEVFPNSTAHMGVGLRGKNDSFRVCY